MIGILARRRTSTLGTNMTNECSESVLGVDSSYSAFDAV